MGEEEERGERVRWKGEIKINTCVRHAPCIIHLLVHPYSSLCIHTLASGSIL